MLALAASGWGQMPTNVQVNPPSTSPFLANAQAEPAIAQNPVNPLNLVVVAMDFSDTPPCPDLAVTFCHFANVSSAGYFASFDGGVTWPCHGLLPVGALGWAEFDPSVAFDSRGNAYYGALSSDNGGLADVMVAKSTDGGCTFASASLASGTAPAAINTTPRCCSGQNADVPDVAADTNPGSPFRDNVYAAWTQYSFAFNPPAGFDVVFARSTDGGTTWSNAANLGTSSKSGDFKRGAPRIGVGTDGAVYVVWFDADSSGTEILMAVSYDGGKTFPAKNITVARVTDDLSPEPVCCLSGRGIPSLTISRNGNLYVGWSNYTNGHGVVQMTKSSDRGQTWSAPAVAADIPGRSAQWSAIAADPSNKVDVVFVGLDELPGGLLRGPGTAYYDAYFVQSNDGGATFSAPLKITNVSSDPGASSRNYLPFKFVGDYIGLAADSRGGGVFAVWTDTRNASRCAAVDALRDSGGPPVNVIAQCPLAFGNNDIFMGKVTY
jgi:hypothetical protein